MTELLSTIFTISYDTLSIPEAMAIPGRTMKMVVYGFLPIFFLIAAVSNVIQTATGSSDIKGLLKRLVLLLVGLQLYDFIFLKVVAFCDFLAMLMGDSGQIFDFIKMVNENAGKQISDAGGGTVAKAVGWIAGLADALSPKNLVMSLLGILINIGEPLLLAIRYALLCLLYVIGPLAFLLAFFPVTRKMLSGWFTNLIQISFWIVTLRILESIIISLNVDSMSKTWPAGDLLPWIMIMTIFIVFLILTPMITAKILSGENLGAVGTLAAGMAMGAVASAATGTGAVGKMIGHKSSVSKGADGKETSVPATGLHAVAEKTGRWATAARAGAGGITKRFGERIRSSRKERPRR